MPIYEYQCSKCQKVTEVWQKVSDPAPKTCKHCGGKKLKKIVSQTAFQLKGSGWYKDLYSSKKPEKSEKKEGTTDSKPDTKPPKKEKVEPA